MAVHTNKTTKVFYNGINISGLTNKASVNIDIAAEPKINFDSSGWEENLPGLISSNIEIEGYYSAPSSSQGTDPLFYNSLNSATNGLITICPDGNSSGGIAYAVPTVALKVSFGEQVGKILPYQFSAKGNCKLFDGTIFRGGATTGSTGNICVVNIPGTSAKIMYGALQVYGSQNLGSFWPKVTRDNEVAFTDPTDVLVFTSSTSPGRYEFLTAVVESTEDYYRVEYETSSNDTFDFNLTFGFK